MLTQHEWQRLSAWMDGELPANDAREVERLVRDDPQWSAAMNRMRSVHDVLDTWKVPNPSETLRQQISQLPQHHRSHGRRAMRVAGWLLPLATAAAVLIVVLGQPGSTAPNTDRPARVSDRFVQDHLEVLAELDERPLRERIHDHTGGSLADALRDETPQWSNLDEPEKQTARRHAHAFLNLPIEQQQELLEQLEQTARSNAQPERLLQKLDRLRIVIDSFTPAQRQALRKMTPAQREREYYRRQEELIRTGILPAESNPRQ